MKQKKRKYKFHRRYREPAIVEAPKKIKIRLKKAPKARDVMHARASIYRKLKRTGLKRYKHHKDQALADVNRTLEKYGIMETSTEQYWRLAFMCILLGV